MLPVLVVCHAHVPWTSQAYTSWHTLNLKLGSDSGQVNGRRGQPCLPHANNAMPGDSHVQGMTCACCCDFLRLGAFTSVTGSLHSCSTCDKVSKPRRRACSPPCWERYGEPARHCLESPLLPAALVLLCQSALPTHGCLYHVAGSRLLKLVANKFVRQVNCI